MHLSVKLSPRLDISDPFWTKRLLGQACTKRNLLSFLLLIGLLLSLVSSKRLLGQACTKRNLLSFLLLIGLLLSLVSSLLSFFFILFLIFVILNFFVLISLNLDL